MLLEEKKKPVGKKVTEKYQELLEFNQNTADNN